MNTTVIGTGQLRHRFWGDYSAVIAIGFSSEEDALLALPTLKVGWSISESDAKYLVWIGDSESLDLQKKNLASFGADESKIDSLKYSVDYGEKFNVTIPVTFVDPNQLSLF